MGGPLSASPSGLGRLGGSSRSLGRNALGSGLLRDDHAFATTVTTGATTADNLATTAAATTATAVAGDLAAAAAAAALADSLAAGITGDGFFAVAAMTSTEQTVAPLAAMAAMMTGKQTTVAPTPVAAMTGDRTAVTADQGDGDEREEHRQRKTKKPLHQKPPPWKTERSGCVPGAVT
jgi:hypothetical protein